MERAFTEWGTICARYPVVIIIVSVALCVSLCSGIKWLEVTTDPIELWASPSSPARIQKDFYDSKFKTVLQDSTSDS